MSNKVDLTPLQLRREEKIQKATFYLMSIADSFRRDLGIDVDIEIEQLKSLYNKLMQANEEK